jgi:hypothetical protein
VFLYPPLAKNAKTQNQMRKQRPKKFFFWFEKLCCFLDLSKHAFKPPNSLFAKLDKLACFFGPFFVSHSLGVSQQGDFTNKNQMAGFPQSFGFIAFWDIFRQVDLKNTTEKLL